MISTSIGGNILDDTNSDQISIVNSCNETVSIVVRSHAGGRRGKRVGGKTARWNPGRSAFRHAGLVPASTVQVSA